MGILYFHFNLRDQYLKNMKSIFLFSFHLERNPNLPPTHLPTPNPPHTSLPTPAHPSGSRYVEGCWGFPCLNIKTVSWFLVFWFLGFWFRGFTRSFMFSKNICYILPNFHFMFFDRYYSHIQYFQDFIKRIVGFCRRPPFRTLSNFRIPNFFRFTKILLFKMFWGVLDFVRY